MHLPRSGVRRQRRSGSSKRHERAEGRDLFEEIEILGELDSHAVEELQLEIRRLARRRGLAIKELRIDTIGEGFLG